ncbi:MAG TPA: CHAT domain-containing protein [Thermoanaerobaculia bacterium]|nr:CHAT domain-containing protein [Thermoanaerobaculia bacterium]
MIRFRLQIQSAAAGGFVVRTACDRGEGRAEMALPLESDTALSLLQDNSRLLGEKLFEALFQGKTLSLYERSLDDLEADADGVFRLELNFDPGDPQVALLQSLPWELLRKPDTPAFVALDRQRSIVRYLLVDRRISAAPKPKKLRILAVAAEPRLPGARYLDLEGELRNLRSAVEESPNLELIELQNATLAALRHTLVEKECHVLHFLGHGGRHEKTGDQVLFFEKERRAADPVTGSDLMNTLAGFPLLRLVVLNACESGSVPEGSEDAPFDPLAGVATSLVLGGLPAVIAMRKPISDPAALAFSRGFYPRLAAGDSIDAAVVEGRYQIHSGDREGDEWATPILFLRAATGELYPARDLTAEGPWTKRLGRRLIAAVAALLLVSGLAFAGRREWVERRVEGLVAQGAAQVTSGRWTEAREFFAEARRLAPSSAGVAANLAATDEQLGDVRSAEDLYREAARLAPESADRQYDLGHFLNDHGNPTEAYSVLSEAVTLPSEPPRNAEVYAELARAAGSRRLFARARAAIITALRLDPERAEYHRRQGEIELAAGSPALAIPPLERAHERFPIGDIGRIETVALLARAEDQLGNGPAACLYVAELRQLDTAGISPWALDVESIAARRRCSKLSPNTERNAP